MSRLAPWLVAALLTVLVAAKFDPRTGFSSLIRFGEAYNATRLPVLQSLPLAVVPNSSGYDGQFYAQIALGPSLDDPALAEALDAPAYRARRILVPAAAFVFGVGDPRWIVQVYALLNVACWFALAALLYREFEQHTAAFARWAACVLSLGVLDSVRQSLVDLPALLLLVLAVRSTRGAGLQPRGYGLLALGHLAKETNLIASLALAWEGRPTARRLLWLAVIIVPLAAWMAYVGAKLPHQQSGLGNFTWPFVGAINQWLASADAISTGNFDSRHTFALVAIPSLFLQAAVILSRRQWSDPWFRIGAAYSLLIVFFGPWIWSGYWAAYRAALPVTLAFNLLLPPNRLFWPLWVIGNITLLHGIWRFL